MHGHRAGLQRGIPGPMIFAITEADNKEDTAQRDISRQKQTEPCLQEPRPQDTSINAATKGGKTNDKRATQKIWPVMGVRGVRASLT